jgi:hypothetical protein
MTIPLCNCKAPGGSYNSQEYSRYLVEAMNAVDHGRA